MQKRKRKRKGKKDDKSSSVGLKSDKNGILNYHERIVIIHYLMYLDLSFNAELRIIDISAETEIAYSNKQYKKKIDIKKKKL